MKLSKKLFSLGAAFLLTATMTPQEVYATPEPFNVTITINGKKLDLDPGAYIENDRTLVPIAQISQAVNATVEWVESSRTVILRRGTSLCKMQIGYDYVGSSNLSSVTYQKLDTCPQIIEDRTYLPLSAITYALGAEVAWDQNTKTAALTLGTVVEQAATRYSTLDIYDPITGVTTEKQSVAVSNVKEPLFPDDVFGYIPVNDPLYRHNSIHSGSNMVDFLLDSLLGTIVTDGMSYTDELKAVYEYVVQNYDHNYDYHEQAKVIEYYLHDFPSYGIGSIAYDALMSKQGTCYHITALFTALTQRMGYPSYMMDGFYINSNGSTMQHHWTALEVGGTVYHFDPDIESIFRVNYGYSYPAFDKFMLNVEQSKQFHQWDYEDPQSNDPSYWT